MALFWKLLNSPAYIALPASAAKALPYFLGKVKGDPFRDPTRYDIEFSFSYGEAQRLGFSTATFHRVICQLVFHGFIDPIDKGGLRGVGGSYSVFKLSERWKDYGNPGFEKVQWKCFQPRYRNRKQRSKIEI